MVTIKAHSAKSVYKRVKGLIGNNTIEPLLLQTRWGIHTVGLKQPIDVLILNTEWKIMAYKKSLKPYRIFLWNPAYKNVLELPSGTMKKHDLKLHDTIKVSLIE